MTDRLSNNLLPVNMYGKQQNMADRLTPETLKGIWAGITLSWDEDYQLDEPAFRENLRRLVGAGVQGIYVFGSTGEFYAVDDDEFRQIVDILVEEVSPSGIPTQAGCNDTATGQVIQKLKYVADMGISAAQVALPFWMSLTEEEVVGFFRDISQAVPDLPLISYNISRTQRCLTCQDYERILEVAPNLIGVKWTGLCPGLAEAKDRLPQLVYSTGEGAMPREWEHGGRVVYSSLVLMAPERAVKVFKLTEAGRIEEAETVAQELMAFARELDNIAEELGLGMMDPVWDKAGGVVTGFLAGHQRCRPPYIGWPDEAIQEARACIAEKFPDFIIK